MNNRIHIEAGIVRRVWCGDSRAFKKLYHDSGGRNPGVWYSGGCGIATYQKLNPTIFPATLKIIKKPVPECHHKYPLQADRGFVQPVEKYGQSTLRVSGFCGWPPVKYRCHLRARGDQNQLGCR